MNAVCCPANAIIMQCKHMHEPLDLALSTLRNPQAWKCHVCSSTDGVWVCLTCGHAGCGRHAHHPELGGGHSRHHYLTCCTREDRSTHAVSLDVVSKAIHCYECDDWVLNDAAWLRTLRADLEMLELEMPLAKGVGDAGVGERAPAQGIPGSTGLSNLGNTCYINSVLQALSNTAGFRSFFRDFLRAEAPLNLGLLRIERQTTEVCKQKAEEKMEPNALELCEATHALLRVLWNGQWKSLAPHHFVQTVWAHGGDFAALRQQDAHEFLSFLLDRLDEELLPREPSPVMTDLFRVDQRQAVLCSECGAVTCSMESAFGLMLPMPGVASSAAAALATIPAADEAEWTEASSSRRTKKKKNKKKNGGDGGEAGEGPSRELSPSTRLSLEDCMLSLTMSEQLEGEDRFFCDHCGCLREATRTTKLHRRPQALLVSFKRTRWTLDMGIHKDLRRIDFPMDRFDASGLLGASDGEDASAGSAEPGALYSLSAVVSHAGVSPQSGHYMAFVRARSAELDSEARGPWLMCNDAEISPVDDDVVRRAEAYILVYERQSASPLPQPTPPQQRKAQHEAGAVGVAVAAAAVAQKITSATAGSRLDENEKQQRKLKKMIRQIEILKTRLDAEDEAALERGQLEKLSREAELRAELAVLEAQGFEGREGGV
jgi:uncharacterized UBP type Zn finger protein